MNKLNYELRVANGKHQFENILSGYIYFINFIYLEDRNSLTLSFLDYQNHIINSSNYFLIKY